MIASETIYKFSPVFLKSSWRLAFSADGVTNALANGDRFVGIAEKQNKRRSLNRNDLDLKTRFIFVEVFKHFWHNETSVTMFIRTTLQAMTWWQSLQQLERHKLQSERLLNLFRQIMRMLLLIILSIQLSQTVPSQRLVNE